MSKQKSWGGSTKSNSLYFSGSPNRQDFKQISNSEVSFLLLKNKQLQQRTLRMAQYIHSIEQDKKELLSMKHLMPEINQRYVESLNQQFKNIHGAFEEEMKKVKRSSLSLCRHCNRDILTEFQKDYRNLVKYSMTLEDEIATKNLDLQKYCDMKRQLLETNHDSISQLINELMETTSKLSQARKDNNRIQFELQKVKRQLQKSRKINSASRGDIERIISENENYKSLINTIQNQSQDKENQLKQKIYQQQVKLQKLEKEVRNSEQKSRNYRKQSEEIRMQQIEMISRSQDLSLSQFKRSIGVTHCKGSRLILS